MAGDGEDIAVAVQGAETAGLDPYLGGPAADVLAACGATGKADEVIPVPVRIADQLRRLLFLGLGDGSDADLRKAGAALGRRLEPDRGMLVAAALGQPAAAVRAFAEGLLLGSYRFSLASDAASGGPSRGTVAGLRRGRAGGRRGNDGPCGRRRGRRWPAIW